MERNNSAVRDAVRARQVLLSECPTDPAVVRQAFSLFPSGVAALSACVEGIPRVLVAASFQVGISADPPLVLFAVQHTSTSWPKLRTCEFIGVSVLGEAHNVAARQMASKAADRLAGIATQQSPTGAIFIVGAPIWLECNIHAEVPAGDHDVIFLRVRSLAVDADAEPLIFHGSSFRRLRPRSDSTNSLMGMKNGQP